MCKARSLVPMQKMYDDDAEHSCALTEVTSKTNRTATRRRYSGVVDDRKDGDKYRGTSDNEAQ